MITYVVYNPALAETLNRKTSFPCCKNAKIYMRAVGSLDEVYSRRNVFLDEHEASAQAIHDSYLAIQKANDLRDMKKRIRDKREGRLLQGDGNKVTSLPVGM